MQFMDYLIPTIYNDYEIYIDPTTNKYGIRNIRTDRIDVKCIFDEIRLYPDKIGLFWFKLNGNEAVYKADDIRNLAQ